MNHSINPLLLPPFFCVCVCVCFALQRADVLTRVEEMCEIADDFTPSQAQHFVEWFFSSDQVCARE